VQQSPFLRRAAPVDPCQAVRDMKAFLKLVVGLGAFYLTVIVVMAVAQDWLLFPRWAVSSGAADLPASARQLTLKTASAEKLAGVYVPADSRPREEAALILGFGGNAWSADALASYLHSVFPDRDVITFDYRGYGQSAGHPSADALLQDARRIHDHLVATMAPERVVAVGLSIGAGPAAHLASRRSIAGLILVTPFDSLSALAREHYPWAPVDLLLRHRMDVAAAVAASATPLALIAAEQDTIVSPRRTEPLRKAARNLVLDRIVIGAGHNDLYDRREFVTAMREALSLIEADNGIASGE
jgi:pimeloyl-ACP methyl ester carboxylesterase